MRNILARVNRELLEQFSWSNVLLAFDYDGTLAAITSEPKQAIMRDVTRSLFKRMALIYPCIVISGRARSDVSQMLKGVSVAAIVGNHGVEPWNANEELKVKVARWREKLLRSLSGLAGVVIEDKVFSLAVHYRKSRQKRLAIAEITAAASQLGEVRLIGGKQVINILPEEAPHKGIALERERNRLGCDTAIYVGDDDTDEDVFALTQPGKLLCIRVGHHGDSAAPFYIKSQRDIDELLKLLIELREVNCIARAK